MKLVGESSRRICVLTMKATLVISIKTFLIVVHTFSSRFRRAGSCSLIWCRYGPCGHWWDTYKLVIEIMNIKVDSYQLPMLCWCLGCSRLRKDVTANEEWSCFRKLWLCFYARYPGRWRDSKQKKETVRRQWKRLGNICIRDTWSYYSRKYGRWAKAERIETNFNNYADPEIPSNPSSLGYVR